MYFISVCLAASDPGWSEGGGARNMKYKGAADGGHLFYD